MPRVMLEVSGAMVGRRVEIAEAPRAIVPGWVIWHERELKPYEADELTAYRHPPLGGMLPKTVEQVSQVQGWCQRESVKIVPRGAETSLSDGALPLADVVLLGLGRMNRVLEIDYCDGVVVVQQGVPAARSPCCTPIAHRRRAGVMAHQSFPSIAGPRLNRRAPVAGRHSTRRTTA